VQYKTSWPDRGPRRERWGGPFDGFPGGRARSRPWDSLAALRPSSPGQLALVGVALWFLGGFVTALHVLAAVGVALLVVAGLSLLVRPRAQIMHWRGRRIELQREPTAAERLYRLIYRTQ
jgi:hypothetical protein